MKMTSFKKILGAVAVCLLATVVQLHAQRGGGGGGGQPPGGGGFFGGGQPGGGGGGRASAGAATAGTYNNNGQVGSAIISVDPQTHNIVVIADPVTAMQISNVIASLDAPKPQVLIKMVFMEVQRNNDLDFGIEGAYNNNHLGSGSGTPIVGSAANVFGLAGVNSIVTNFNAITTLGTPMLAPGAAGANGFYQIFGNNFQATLKAIAASGKAQVLSRPSVLARDGQVAKIVIGQQVYLPSGVSQSTGVGAATALTTINGTYTDVGIILNVTPFIGANGMVEMILQPQITSIDKTTPGQAISVGGVLGGGTIYAPNLNVRSADTVVQTPDRETVVIGGLISNNKSYNDSRIPILGDIPLVGLLFKSSSRNEGKTELLMFLTPNIVRTPDQLAAMTTGETARSQLITNSITEQELNRFLERIPVKKTSKN